MVAVAQMISLHGSHTVLDSKPVPTFLRNNGILHSTQHTRHSQEMLPHHHITYKDKIYYNVTLARLCTSSLRMVEDRNM
jgi:hypothetical protein